MAITNPGVIAYSNEVFRPLCEQFRNLKYKVDDALLTFNNVHATNCPDDPLEILEDGRSGDGVSVITGEDINRIINYFTQFQTMMDGPNVSTNMNRPCVRALQVV